MYLIDHEHFSINCVSSKTRSVFVIAGYLGNKAIDYFSPAFTADITVYE